MAWLDEFEEEDVAAALGSVSSGVQSVEWDGNLIGTPIENSTGFMSMLSRGFKELVDKSLVGQAAKVLNKIAPSTWSNMTEKERFMAGGARGFYKNEDGTWNVSNPFKIDPNTGEEAIRKHKMVSFLGEEFPMGSPIEIDDTTPFMLEHFQRGEINSDMLAKKRFLWDKYKFYSNINPTLAKTYLDQYNNIESTWGTSAYTAVA